MSHGTHSTRRLFASSPALRPRQRRVVAQLMNERCPLLADSVEKLSLPFRRATLIHQRQARGPQRFKMTSGSDQTLRYRSASPTFSTESALSRPIDGPESVQQENRT